MDKRAKYRRRSTKIQLSKNTGPTHSSHYRNGPRKRHMEWDKASKKVAENVVELSVAQWPSLIVFASKKDGSLRFCVDYWKLNEETVRNSNSISQIDEGVDSLGSAKVFFTLDAHSNYWQTERYQAHMQKTAAVTHSRMHRFTRMLFGLKFVIASFQGAMDITSAPVSWQHAPVYLHDAIMFSVCPEDHLHHV